MGTATRSLGGVAVSLEEMAASEVNRYCSPSASISSVISFRSE
jgi:hypothetical protein